MNEEMRQDCVDLVITACERYAGNFEVRTRGVWQWHWAAGQLWAHGVDVGSCEAPKRLRGVQTTPRLRRSVCPVYPRSHHRFCVSLSCSQMAARQVKETMDKKYNESWVVIIGEGFGFEVRNLTTL